MLCLLARRSSSRKTILPSLDCRPFAHFAAFLETTTKVADDGTDFKGALARLNEEVRAVAGGAVWDALRLACWFRREAQPVDADRVRSDLEFGNRFNDLELLFWQP